METPSCKGNFDEKVSRSGRVLKKSSKLADFASPDDIETAKLKKIDKAARKQLNLTQFSSHIKMEPELDLDPSQDRQKPYMMQNSSFLSNPDGNYVHHSNRDEEDSDSDEPPMVIKTEDDPEVDFNTPRRSLYMTEKSSKKKIIKNGKTVLVKAQRKDKGKTRFTAYMLWAKETRQQITQSNPELDFASVSKKLGEMWANVPANVKYNWKRRAKRLANKLRKSNGKLKNQEPSKYIQQKYLNKNSTNLLNSSNNHPNTTTSTSSANVPLTKQQKQLQKLMKSEKLKKQSIQNAQKQQKEQKQMSAHKKLNSSMDSTLSPPSSSYKSSPQTPSKIMMMKPSLTPMDMAAHLKLLGENLTNIGDRLKEHEGQIAVSGSLSVLLDSLLCAMGPLICLTSYIPRLDLIKSADTQQIENDNQQYVTQLLHNTMDNIGYIMPGL